MNSFLLPEMNDMLESSLAILAIVAPLGLAYVLIGLHLRGPDRQLRKPSEPHK